MASFSLFFEWLLIPTLIILKRNDECMNAPFDVLRCEWVNVQPRR